MPPSPQRDVLGRIEAEGRRRAQRCRPGVRGTPPRPRERRLRHGTPCRAAIGADLVHVARMTGEMDDERSPCVRGVTAAASACRIHVEGVGLYVAEDRRRPAVDDDVGRGGEGDRRCHTSSPGPTPRASSARCRAAVQLFVAIA